MQRTACHIDKHHAPPTIDISWFCNCDPVDGGEVPRSHAQIGTATDNGTCPSLEKTGTFRTCRNWLFPTPSRPVPVWALVVAGREILGAFAVAKR
jgi:hypothetical protein